MKSQPRLIIAVGAMICIALLGLATAYGTIPVWVQVARPLLSLVIIILLGGPGRFSSAHYWANYGGPAPLRFALTFVALILIPVALFAVYRLYYGPLISLANSNDQAF